MGLDLYKNVKMDVPVRCEKCGSMHIKYEGIGEYKCEDCGWLMYDDYGKVRSFLERNPGATVVETSVATGVSKNRIKDLLEEDKIQIAPDSAVFLHCVNCGANITSGRYCNKCLKEASAAEKNSMSKSHISGGFGAGKNAAKGEKRFERR